MSYTVTPTTLPGVLILEPQVFTDDRGVFFESFQAREFANVTGVTATFVQDNHSRSQQGVLRGLHYQMQATQGKLVRVSVGAVYDVAVDLRRSSATFGQWMGLVVSADNYLQVWIPPGFAHGFLVLSAFAEVQYKTTAYWDAAHEHCLRWDDPDLAIAWPLDAALSHKPKLSAKDAQAPSWRQALDTGAVFA